MFDWNRCISVNVVTVSFIQLLINVRPEFERIIDRNPYRNIVIDRGICRVSEVSIQGIGARQRNNGTFIVTFFVTDQGLEARHSGRSLVEQPSGERLEAIERVAKVSEFQLRFGCAVEETAPSILAIDVTEYDVLVEEPKSLGGSNGGYVVESNRGDLFHLDHVYVTNRTQLIVVCRLVRRPGQYVFMTRQRTLLYTTPFVQHSQDGEMMLHSCLYKSTLCNNIKHGYTHFFRK